MKDSAGGRAEETVGKDTTGGREIESEGKDYIGNHQIFYSSKLTSFNRELKALHNCTIKSLFKQKLTE